MHMCLVLQLQQWAEHATTMSTPKVARSADKSKPRVRKQAAARARVA